MTSCKAIAAMDIQSTLAVYKNFRPLLLQFLPGLAILKITSWMIF